jgi:hypothetical protein
MFKRIIPAFRYLFIGKLLSKSQYDEVNNQLTACGAIISLELGDNVGYKTDYIVGTYQGNEWEKGALAKGVAMKLHDLFVRKGY